MKDILPYLKPYRRRIALAMLLVAAATVCDLLLPTIMNDILNNGVRQSDFAYIVRCCAWMLAVAAAGLAALLAGGRSAAMWSRASTPTCARTCFPSSTI